MVLLTHAKEFQRAANLIGEKAGVDDHTGGLRDRGFHHLFYFLCGHSIELFIKASLLAVGRDHAELKKLGHDLTKCLSAMQDQLPRHQPVYKDCANTIELLNSSYVAKEFEYRVTGARTWPTVPELLYVVEELRLIAEETVTETAEQ